MRRTTSRECPWGVSVQKPGNHHYWTPALDRSKRELCRLRTKSEKTNRQYDIDAYKDKQYEYNKDLRRAQDEPFRKFVSDTSTIEAMAKLNKILRSVPSKQVGMLKRPDGTMTTNPEQACDVLLSHCFKNSKEIPNSEDDSVLNFENEIADKFVLEIIPWMSLDDIKTAIKTFNPTKASGPDAISPRMLRHIPDEFITRLGKVFMACYQSGYTPKEWLRSFSIFLPKEGKDDYTKPGSFRPICLTSVYLKLMEKLIYKNLLETNLKENPLHPSQHGFRRGMSCETALSTVLNRLEKSILEPGGVAISIFLDVQGAFDNVNPHSAIKAMKNRGFPPKMIKWYSNYLLNRLNISSIKGVSTEASHSQHGQ